jgi:alkylated DNA repair dioxygenase AlkB
MTDGSLFPPDLPEGFRYREEFLSAADELTLVKHMGRVPFSAFEMHGVIARRRVAFYGATYEVDRPAEAFPDFLLPARAQAAAWVGIPAEAFAMALVNEYPPGAPIGWHRDAPQYDVIVGLSLLSPCRMKFRPYFSPGDRSLSRGSTRKTTNEIVLAPRSIYVIDGVARRSFEHSIPAVPTLRYSITFRTLRSPRARR